MEIKYHAQFLLDKEKDSLTAKVRLRIKWNGKVVAFNLGNRVDIAKWSIETQRCKTNTTHGEKKVAASVINRNIQNFENGIFFSQQEIDRVLTRGSGFEEGKYRINQMFSKNTTLKEKVQFLKKEYGEGGSSPAVGFINANYDAKGMSLSRYREIGKDEIKITLKWDKVAKRIDELIQLDRYLNKKEKEYKRNQIIS